MGLIMDLTAYVEETADIRMQDGTLLHLRKPSQRMVIHMMQMRDISADTDTVEIMRVLDDVTMEILNNNADSVQFRREAVQDMPADLKTRIIGAYSEWAAKLQSNPTMPSRPTRGGHRKAASRS